MIVEIGEKMKEKYENSVKFYLKRKIPVAIRIDGRAFHTFTKNFKKPFDYLFSRVMQTTMEYLCENIQGCVFGYTQSDEITLILIDYKNPNSSAWFNYNIQKMCSVAASMATMKFYNSYYNYIDFTNRVHRNDSSFVNSEKKEYLEIYEKALAEGATFDARCFNIPKEEVVDLLYWRQLDSIRNSIQTLGRYYFSQSELFKISSKKIKELLLKEKNFDWETDLYSGFKTGICCFKVNNYYYDESNKLMTREKWIIDDKVPSFKEDKEYIEKHIYINENK